MIVPEYPIYMESNRLFEVVNPISGGCKNLTTFLTTPSPLPHHSGKNLTTFARGGEVCGEENIPPPVGVDVAIRPFRLHFLQVYTNLTTSPLFKGVYAF